MRRDAGSDSGAQTGTARPSAQSRFDGNVFSAPVHTGSGALNVVYNISDAAADPLERLALALARKVAAVERVARQSLLGDAGTAAEIPYASRLTWLGDAGKPAAGTLETIVDDFRALPHGRLAVLGNAGSGKTVLALDFVQQLLQRRQPGELVPVRLALAQWNPDVALDEWLTSQVAESYGLRRRQADRLVRARMVLPVLDGLDEMDATPAATSRAEQALQQINRYHGSRGPAPLILTCRSETYHRLAVDTGALSDAASILLEDLTETHIRAYLAQVLAGRPAAERAGWAEVLGNLGGLPPGALSTPWRLYLATTVYAGGYDPRELFSRAGLGSIDNLLLSRLIPVAVAAFPRPRYEARTVTSWLSALARSLESAPNDAGSERAAATDLVLYRLPGPGGARRLARLQYAVTVAACCAVLGPLLIRVWRVNGYGSAIGTTLVFLLISMTFSLPALQAPPPVPIRLVPYRRRSKLTLPQLVAWIAPDRRKFLAPLVRFAAAALVLSVLSAVVLRFAPSHANVAEILAVTGAWVFLFVGVPLILVGIAVTVRVIGTWFAKADSLPVLRPGAPLRQDLAVSGVAAAAVTPWAFLLPGPLTLAAMVAVVFCGTRAWARYGLGVASYRRHGLLPLRLGRFLAWAHRAGLVRASGIAYQFRHAEFQRWLAADAAPPGNPPG
jgi:hypothetical protein